MGDIQHKLEEELNGVNSWETYQKARDNRVNAREKGKNVDWPLIASLVEIVLTDAQSWPVPARSSRAWESYESWLAMRK